MLSRKERKEMDRRRAEGTRMAKRLRRASWEDACRHDGVGPEAHGASIRPPMEGDRFIHSLNRKKKDGHPYLWAVLGGVAISAVVCFLFATPLGLLILVLAPIVTILWKTVIYDIIDLLR